MSKSKEITFEIKCPGRKAPGIPALEKPVDVKVTFRQSGNSIHGNVECPHNTGGHGQRCKASHPPGIDKVGEGVECPYSLDIPWYSDQELVKPF